MAMERLDQDTERKSVISITAIDDFSECDICSAIWSRLGDSPDNAKKTPINFGSFEEALHSNCKRHKSIVEWFKKFCDAQNQTQTVRPPKASNDVGIHRPRPGVLALTESIENFGWGAELCLIRRDSVKNHPGIARLLDPKWVDLSVINHWLEQCVSSHGTKCENPVKIWPYRPAWVIDTKAKCLVPGEKCASFIALSYRWGVAPGLHIQPDTMSDLQRPNSLDDPAIANQLAPMVRHAIALASSIGQRYLWVDTLCIDHSRIAESTTQLQNMGAIYANASLTIVALDRDSKDGFLGLRDISREKDQDDEVPVQFGNERFIRDKLHYFGLTSWSAYHERGWTFQEFNMSPRRLIFSKDSLHWMCQCSVWEEHLHHGVEARKYLDPRVGEIMRGMPNIRSLSNLIGYYNDKKFSYDEDCLSGITGLLTVFSRCFSGGFLCGIPEMFLETALSWQPTWYHTDLRRRRHSDRFDTSRLHPCLLPSWSWIGWEGLVDIGSLEAGPANPRTWKLRETIPITTWYACSSSTMGQKRKIKATWYESRELYKDFERALLPGWTRHAIPKVTSPGYGDGQDGDVLLYPDGCDKSTFRHRNMIDDDDEHEWHWPFPVPDIDESTQPCMPEQLPYLCCDTRRAFVFAFQAGDDNETKVYKSGEYNKAELYSKKKVVIGSLHLHNKQQLEHFPPSESDWATAKKVELVAISRARRYKQTFDDRLGCYTAPFTSWEVYSILWVEWIDGVAHRLACGEVDKAAWEELVLEDVCLILG